MSRRPKLHRYIPMARWSPKLAIQRSNRRIDDAAQAIADIALTWGDVDQCIVDRAEELLFELRQFGEEIEVGISERLANGDEVGR